jgi:hypothetical protein
MSRRRSPFGTPRERFLYTQAARLASAHDGPRGTSKGIVKATRDPKGRHIVAIGQPDLGRLSRDPALIVAHRIRNALKASPVGVCRVIDPKTGAVTGTIDPVTRVFTPRASA